MSRLPVQSFEMTKKEVKAFRDWLESELSGAPALGICIESTGIYSKRFARALYHLSLPPVAIVNPYFPLSFKRSLGVRDKSDKVDARTLALFGAVRRPTMVAQRSPEYERLKELHRLWDDYEKDIRAWNNRLEQADDRSIRTSIKRTIKHLEKSSQGVWAEIERLVAENERMKSDAEIMCTIPGIGEKTAYLLLAELGDLRTWKRNEIVSYCGLFPREHTSGTSVVKRPRLAGGGGKRIRRNLYMCACSLRKTESRIARFGRELNERDKSNMCAIAAMMRKLLVTVRAVVKSGIPYDHSFSIQQQ